MNHFAEMVEPRCPWGFIEMAGKCVYFSQKHEAASWSDAKQACEQGTLGLGNLAVLRTKSDLHVMNALRNMYGKSILHSYFHKSIVDRLRQILYFFTAMTWKREKCCYWVFFNE